MSIIILTYKLFKGKNMFKTIIVSEYEQHFVKFFATNFRSTCYEILLIENVCLIIIIELYSSKLTSSLV